MKSATILRRRRVLLAVALALALLCCLAHASTELARPLAAASSRPLAARRRLDKEDDSDDDKKPPKKKTPPPRPRPHPIDFNPSPALTNVPAPAHVEPVPAPAPAPAPLPAPAIAPAPTPVPPASLPIATAAPVPVSPASATTESSAAAAVSTDPPTAGAETCPRLNEITTSCGGVCGNNVACVRYRRDGVCQSGHESSCLRSDRDGCTYECLDGTSSSFDEWYIQPFGAPQWDPQRRNASHVEAIREIHVPRNVTRLSFRLAFDGEDGKGRVASLEFPDGVVVSADSSLQQLALINVDIANVPKTIYTPQLRSLVLQNCLLKEVPAPVLGLQKLSFLYVSENALTTFPSVSALEELTLDDNELTDFSAVIPSLRNLYLKNNALVSFPSSLQSLPLLSELDLAGNQITTDAIRAAITNKLYHAKLQELVLNSNDISILPDLSEVFPVLSTLRLRNNTIDAVAGAMNGKWEQLILRGNRIKTFDASFTRLKSLDIGDNLLEALPNLDKLSPVLETLNISMNRFEKLELAVPISTLVALNASKNALTSFALRLPRLRVLDLSWNRLPAIPASVWECASLEQLYLQNNTGASSSPQRLTRDQFVFLRRLVQLTFDAAMVRPSNCPSKWLAELHGQTVCVEGGAPDVDVAVVSTASAKVSTWTWISICLGALVAAAGLLTAALIVARRRQRDREMYGDASTTTKHRKLTIGTQRTHDSESASTFDGFSRGQNGTLLASIWDDEDLLACRVDFDSVQLDRKVAAGAFGEVWLGQYRGACVAVKKLSDHAARDHSAVGHFVREIKILGQLDHPRILTFYGVAWTTLTDLCAVVEYMPRGDLFALLRTPALAPVARWSPAKMQIALDVIEALTYVHTLDPKLVHRDLKSRNVLLDDAGRAKLCDFGVSRMRSELQETMTSGVGTGRWMAPEVLLGRDDYDERVDIYSFGIVLSELDTHELPFMNAGSRQSRPENATTQPLSEVAVMQLVASGELTPTFSATCPPGIVDIARKCVSFRPEDRPSTLEVAYALRQLAPQFLGDTRTSHHARPSRPSVTSLDALHQRASQVLRRSMLNGRRPSQRKTSGDEDIFRL
ncbi:hypothetical protein ATCC90586_004436 [Pythium insidiosum]|nr:hypothetical protein ATCC90586_004436 [Pythium insidiosum]